MKNEIPISACGWCHAYHEMYHNHDVEWYECPECIIGHWHYN